MRKLYYLYPALVLAVFLGVIQISTLTPYWSTSSRNVAGSSIAPTKDGTGAIPAGVSFDTSEIKGSWSLGDVAATFQVPSAEIKEQFGLPASVPDSTAVKDLKTFSAGFEPEMLREWLKTRSPVAVR